MDASLAVRPQQSESVNPNVRTMVRWEFEKGSQRLSCQVDRNVTKTDAATFSVILFPYKYLSLATSEIFDQAASALRRHASLARDLRDAGWKLVAYTK